MCELRATHMKTEQATPKYKRYDAAFKHSAVEHWTLSGKSARIIAGELGINEQSLHKWKQQSRTLPAGQAADTLEQLQTEEAMKQRQPMAGLVHHSNRGVQPDIGAYSQRLALAGLILSMSRRGNCYDKVAIFQWIEVFYNRERLHSALGYKSSVEF